VKLEIFDSKEKCICVRTLNLIERGHFVGQYIGEIIDREEADRRLEEHKSSEHNYLLTYREHFGQEKTLETIVDARHSGNLFRFVNHSCDPNLIVIPVRSDSITPTLCFFASKRIPIGEELTYDYGSCDSSLSDKLCHCNTDKCRHYLPSDCL